MPPPTERIPDTHKLIAQRAANAERVTAMRGDSTVEILEQSGIEVLDLPLTPDDSDALSGNLNADDIGVDLDDEPCEGFDYSGGGCPGHIAEDSP